MFCLVSCYINQTIYNCVSNLCCWKIVTKLQICLYISICELTQFVSPHTKSCWNVQWKMSWWKVVDTYLHFCKPLFYVFISINIQKLNLFKSLHKGLTIGINFIFIFQLYITIINHLNKNVSYPMFEFDSISIFTKKTGL